MLSRKGISIVCLGLAWMASGGGLASENPAGGADIEAEVRASYAQLQALGGGDGADGGALTYTILYSDAEGKSHFGEETRTFHPVPTTDQSLGSAFATQPFDVDFTTIISLPPGATTDWHPAVQRTLNVVMSGELEITVSDETRRFAAGDFFIGFDPGIGHISANPGDEPLHMLIAPISTSNADE